MHLSIFSILTERCNYSCSHCSTSSTRNSKNQIKSEVLLSVLESFSKFKGLKKHLVSGGEIVLYPDLKKVLIHSKDLGYNTNAVTNASWVDINNLDRSRELLDKFFPEKIEISTSIDIYHLEQDKNLIKKVMVLEKLCEGRNSFTIDGAYNGKKEFLFLERLLNQRKTNLIPVQSIGSARKLKLLNKLNEDKIYCPKGNNLGFTLTSKGVYFCFRGALNKNIHLKISEDYSSEKINHFIEDFSTSDLNKKIRLLYKNLNKDSKNKINYPCDLCEILGNS
ncbi:MAG: Radical SAM protein [archaeon GW2011_AR1]|nr:MAG: Radical SAM protein [archaeon GW2011_AR1]